MTDYDNTNRGALFKAKQQATENHPGYTGTLNVGGKEYWISAWVKESKAGEKYFSLSVKPKEDKAPTKQTAHSDDFIDDIPFS